jgi:hypothetical protein
MSESASSVADEGNWSIKKGTRLRIESRRYTPIATGSIELEDLACTDGRVLMVQTWTNGWCHIWGSAAMVAPGIALTAAHVVQQFVDSGHLTIDGTVKPLAQHNKTSLMAVGIRGDNTETWAVRKVLMNQSHDLALLIMDLRQNIEEEYICNVLEISTKLPAIGEQITQVGFVASTDRFELNDPIGFQADVTHIATTGNVTSCYPEGRDRAVLPFPCFEVQSQSFSGMSGGPAFDSNGRIIGMVTSSLKGEDGELDVSYVSLLWPILIMPFTHIWPPTMTEERILLTSELTPVHERWRLKPSSDFKGFSYDDGENLNVYHRRSF